MARTHVVDDRWSSDYLRLTCGGTMEVCASSALAYKQAIGHAAEDKGETENGTERLATSAENRSYLTAFLFFLV